MSRAIILQHVEHFRPGRIVPLLRDYGIPVEIRRLDKGDEVPTDLDELRMLIVLDGPMRLTGLAEGKHPSQLKTIELLKRMVAADRAVLGIGLGAQLLAHAAGAKVYPNARPGDPPAPVPEFGWGPVLFPFPGGTEPIVMGLIDGMPMFHCHFDTFDLPKLPMPANPAPPPAPPPPTGSALLSSSRLCKNQAFRFKTRLFGFQYHFELTQEDIAAVLAGEREAFTQALGPDAEKKITDETARCYGRYARAGDRIVRNFVQFLKMY